MKLQTKADAASVALIAGDRVLLIQRARPPLEGFWTLPGGRREAGETIEATAGRELREELGLAVAALLPVRRMAVAGFRLQVFATSNFSGDIAPSDEIAAWQWIGPEEIVGLKTTPGLAEVLAAAFRLVRGTGPGARSAPEETSW